MKQTAKKNKIIFNPIFYSLQLMTNQTVRSNRPFVLLRH